MFNFSNQLRIEAGPGIGFQIFPDNAFVRLNVYFDLAECIQGNILAIGNITHKPVPETLMTVDINVQSWRFKMMHFPENVFTTNSFYSDVCLPNKNFLFQNLKELFIREFSVIESFPEG